MRKKTVLVLIPTFSQTIEQRICAGIHESLLGEDCRILHAPIGYLPETKGSLDQWLWIHEKLKAVNPDVILAYGGGLSYKSGELIYRRILDTYGDIPIVNMGNDVKGLTSIVVDNYHGMHELMRTVLARRPNESYVFISGPAINEDSLLRQQALEDVLTESGCSLSSLTVIEGDFTASVAQTIFGHYLDTTIKPARTIICANDLTAKGVLDCLSERGLSCPEHFWVTGFDDFEYAASMQPGLSTVHFPAKDVGIQAASIAKRILNGETDFPQSLVVKGYAVLRGTTGDVHPGLGSYDKQLSEQWALIHQRDNNARKLIVLRSFQRRAPLNDLLTNVKNGLADLNVKKLSIFVQKLADDGKGYVVETEISGQTHEDLSGVTKLPMSFGFNVDDDYWLMCPLSMEDVHYGYLVAKCSLVSAEFVEFLAPQFTEHLHTEALEARNEDYRLQNELNERMASLGSLVSGVAHEVNTPIGTGKLAASSMLDSLSAIRQKMSENKLTKNDFDGFVEECEELSGIIFHSLDRAADLISSFKMVSVDQTAEAKRRFDLGEYIGSVLISLRHQLKGLNIELTTDLASGIMVEAFPGGVAQVITNVFMNSIKHGFDNGSEAGLIHFELRKQHRGFRLEISDNGRGATQEVLSHIFDPFFTTTRGSGGSGLGMHIVYNILTQKLNWYVQLESEPNKGFKAIIQPSL